MRKSPVLFLIENNHYAFSTPTSAQYTCRRLSDRAAGYGIAGRTIDGTDPWEVYAAVSERWTPCGKIPLPAILECMTLRLHGHAAYDKGLYVPESLMAASGGEADPLPRTREKLQKLCGLSEAEVKAIDDSGRRGGAGGGERARWRLPDHSRRPQAGSMYAPGDARGEEQRRAGRGAGQAAASPRRQERRRRPHGLGIYPGQQSGGLSGRAWTSASTARPSRRARG